MSPYSKKRTREDLAHEEGAERERKKPRPLTLRTTCPPLDDPVAAVHLHPPTLTPDSSEEDSGAGGFAGKAHRMSFEHGNNLDTTNRQQSSDPDVDLEMLDFQPESYASLIPPYSGGSMCTQSSDVSMLSPIPSQLINKTLNVDGGRTATPIYSHFTSNMNVDVMMKDNNSPTVPSPCTAENPPSGSPHFQELWRRRRLPSPISEGERSPNLVSSSDAKSLEDTGQSVGSGPLHSKAVTSSAALAYDTQTERHNDDHGRPNTRSRMSRTKMGIAMGYRADCDKCQRRVPGHYSHVIRS